MEQTYWTEYTRMCFLEESGLMFRSDLGSQEAREMIAVFKKHVHDETNAQIAEELHLSSNQVDDYIRDLKNIYDDIVYYTFKLIPRTNLSKKDEQIQLERYGFILSSDSIRKYRGLDR